MCVRACSMYATTTLLICTSIFCTIPIFSGGQSICVCMCVQHTFTKTHMQTHAHAHTHTLLTCTSVFCTIAIFSGGQSSPREPLLIMMPSACCKMPLRFSSAWRVSILARMRVVEQPMESRNLYTCVHYERVCVCVCVCVCVYVCMCVRVCVHVYLMCKNTIL